MVLNSNENMSKFFSKIYLWMFIGLLISGGIAYYTSVTPSMMKFVFNNYIFIIILELVVVVILNALRKKVSPLAAKILFVLYSAVSGLTLTSVFLVFKIKSVAFVFLAAAVMFALLAIYGYVTKNDLTSFGKILLFALIAIIIMSLINIFIGNNTFDIVISIISIVVFLGLTAWDMQALKTIYNYYSQDSNELNKMAIYGALDLYLDFINIFLNLLNLFGERKD